MIIASLNNLIDNQRGFSIIESVLKDKPVIPPLNIEENQSFNISQVDAQTIYRNALQSFGIDPQTTQYFKNKK